MLIGGFPGLIWLALPWLIAADGLPRFTEEREAAALHFVRKHAIELLPILEELNKTYRPQYERQIREIFQVTEILADLRDEPMRYTLELNIWKAENRAYLLVARLAGSRPEDRKMIEAQLQAVARDLVELDLRSLELRADSLQSEVQELRNEVTRLRERLDESVRTRYDLLLEQVKKRRKE